MKEPITDQFLSKSLEYLGSTEAFLKAEVPAFIQEFITWKFYENGADIILCIFGLFLMYKLSKILIKETLEPFIVATGFCGVILGVQLYCSTLNMIKIKVAPRVYMLEQVKSLIK